MSAQEENDKSQIYKELRSMPEFSVIISFLEAFGERIGIRNVTAEDLENALINSENSTLVYTVHKSLLKELGKKIGYVESPSIVDLTNYRPDNWQRYVRREFIRRKELNDVLGEYPFTDDEQVIAEDLANQPLFKKRKLDHIPSEDTENPANANNNNNTVKKEKKKDRKRDSNASQEPKDEKVDRVENEQKSDNGAEVKKDADTNENDKKEEKENGEKKEESSNNGKNSTDEKDEDKMEDNEDSEDQEFNADVSPEEMQKLQNEDDDEMDAEDKYVDDEEELNARRSSRLSQKFVPAEEDPDLVRRSSRLSKRKREDDEENGNNENGSDDNSGDEGSEQEPTAAKKMINTYYHPLSPKSKVIILRNLCEWILDRPTDRVQKEAKTLQDTDMQRLRPDPIYIDHKKGDNYWFFGKVSEERIFKERVEEHEYKFKNSAELLKKDGESATIDWNTLTTSLAEVQEFFRSLENDSKTKELREFINEEILPPLITKQRKKDQAARRAASLDTLGLNRTNILRETRTRRRAAMDSKCIYDIDTVLDWDNLK